MLVSGWRFPHPREQQCPQSMYDAQMAQIVESIRSHRTPVPGGAEGLANMRIVHAAYESARTRQVAIVG
jgi:predicted dehydrogenase